MRPRVYVETTVVSYLTARPARDVVVAGRQQSTRDWWSNAAPRFELVASELVFNEAAEGDAEAARDRLDVLSTVTPLDATQEALALAQRLVDEGAGPAMAAEDAAHIAIAGLQLPVASSIL